jgi:ectoine hydroxylase-related dioxygenase (phytanoyl-CoA dioxygenase family)
LFDAYVVIATGRRGLIRRATSLPDLVGDGVERSVDLKRASGCHRQLLEKGASGGALSTGREAPPSWTPSPFSQHACLKEAAMTEKYTLPDEKLRQFHEEGYCILDNVIDGEIVQFLRDECSYFVAREDRKMDALGVDVLDITHRNKRYHASFCIRDREELGRFAFGPVMEELCRKLVGPDAYLFYDQFVVKGSDAGMKLSWHQDSGYVNSVNGDISHKPYITVWCPLDDVTEENGTVYILPQNIFGDGKPVPHHFDKASNDWVGYDGPERGVAVEAKAGSIAVFSSMTLHSSGANRTSRMRRVYLVQYSPEPVLTADRKMLWGNALPFLKNGEIVVGSAMPDLPLRIDRLLHAGQKLEDAAANQVEG